MSSNPFVLGAKPKRKNKSPEHDLQVRLVALLNSYTPKPLYTATVGGVRLAIHTAKKMKAAGYSKGVPDMLIFEPRGMFVGLAIEVKTKTGRASTYQKEWIRCLNDRGWSAHIAHGYEECEEIIKAYFNE
tara:strand:- start:466 stop:855 length:390 start_codon:yes stop_codon:yes gene_type:complete